VAARSSHLLAALSLLASAGSEAHAFSALRPEDDAKTQSQFQKTAVIDEDGRMTEEEYARKKGIPLTEVQNRFAATGVLKCAKHSASGQLTGSDNTITTVAHIFVGMGCNAKNTPRNCSFTAKFRDREQTSEISELVGMGFKCPIRPKRQNDWAVLKLKSPMRGITPYTLPYPDEDVKDRDDVISVAASGRDFDRADPRTGKKVFTKSIEECQGRQPYYEDGFEVLFLSNCDSSPGSSGGSILRARKRYDVLMGITANNNETDTQIAQAAKRGTPNHGPYVEGKWATYQVPLSGEFLQLLETAIGGRPPL
jgi:hypothetical protein